MTNPAAGLIAAINEFTQTILTVGPMVLAAGAAGLVCILAVYAVTKS